MSEQKNLLDELEITLVELNKAIENVREAYGIVQAIQSLHPFSGEESSSWLEWVKKFDLQKIQEVANDPSIKSMLTDPELMDLFAADTGTTPGTPTDSSI